MSAPNFAKSGTLWKIRFCLIMNLDESNKESLT